ncbi:hypothetical protein LP316_09325 [Thalassotalea sp. LPB0316]|uniref:hypothetical protein n=1 Tax=Thalassotalea sp. LPB0316 TaxID=2769490 RepID=UPI0018669EBD|nr:hypothetical protein [Thalassotalea sp. LPB0316]QOL24559.1 hypothetical protein LP316_09325 [Thalassotalea sp. LPB0316]
MYRTYGFCFLLMWFSNQLVAYQFEVENVELAGKESPIHEQMTLLAALCYLNNTSEMPRNCLSKDLVINDVDLVYPNSSLTTTGEPVFVQDLMRASRWSDDPTRLSKAGNKRKTALKSIGTTASACVFLRPTWRFPFVYRSDMRRSILGGLFCSSHYGSMQFLHSMSSRSADYSFNPEPMTTSLNKAKAWGSFTMDFFRDKTLKNEDFCSYFEGILNDDTKIAQHEFAQVFKLNSAVLSQGRDKSQFHCNDAVTLRFLFNNECTDPFSSTDCNIIHDDKKLEIAALGALLHMIQDAYSTSHTQRVNDLQPEHINTVYCKTVSEFYEYNAQHKHGVQHADSDKPPISFDESCYQSENPILDPITASAIAIWYAMQTEQPEFSIESFLAKHVYGE